MKGHDDWVENLGVAGAQGSKEKNDVVDGKGKKGQSERVKWLTVRYCVITGTVQYCAVLHRTVPCCSPELRYFGRTVDRRYHDLTVKDLTAALFLFI
jgi:hypothetical protein